MPVYEYVCACVFYAGDWLHVLMHVKPLPLSYIPAHAIF
jgi:hypothetical protein